jgi:multicomponent Na+:H+ antiporter subunit E
VLLIAHRTSFFDVNVYALHLTPRLPGFWLWLLGQIVRSNLAVARIVLCRRPRIEPTLTSVDASHLPAVAQATLANAITLTPGTVTIGVERGVIKVHCLNLSFAAELEHGEMLRRAERLTGE